MNKAALANETFVTLPPRERSDNRKLCSEGASGPPVGVAWSSLDRLSIKEVLATISNSNTSEVVVNPALRMESPRGDVRTLPLPPQTLPAGGAVVIRIPHQDLPVHSKGLPSVAVLTVSWSQESAEGTNVLRSAQAQTAEAYITVAEDSDGFDMRGLGKQLDLVSLQRKYGEEARLSGLSLADASRGRIQVLEEDIESSITVAIGETLEVGQ